MSRRFGRLNCAILGWLLGFFVSSFAHATPSVDEDRDEATQALSGIAEYMRYVDQNKDSSEVLGTIVVLGGFNSCKPTPVHSGIFRRTRQLLDMHAAMGKYYRIVTGCFSLSNQTVYYYSTASWSQINWISPDEFVDVVESELMHTVHRRLYLVGHSYGGWLSMKTALNLSKETKISGIATIDPISAVQCTPSIFASAYVGAYLGYDPAPECTRAPADIGTSLQNKIRSRVGWWYSFYQLATKYLHSGPIASAVNKYIDFNASRYVEIGTSHRAIGIDARVWGAFEHLIGDVGEK